MEPSDRVREKWRAHATDEFLSRKVYQDMDEYNLTEFYSRNFQKVIRVALGELGVPDVVWRDTVIGDSQHH